MPYVVMVDGNFHYMDESECYRAGEFATAEEAVARCRQIVDNYLDHAQKIKENSTATALWQSYVMFGEGPFVVANGAEPVDFSAWGYARERCEERCGGRIEDSHPSRRDPIPGEQGSPS
jgi:hypothetical protein